MISASATKIVLNLENLDEYKAKVKLWDSHKGLNNTPPFLAAASPQQGQDNLTTKFDSYTRVDPSDPKQVADKKRRERLGIR